MVTTDPIADMLVRIKNAGAAGKSAVSIPYSAVKMEIAEVLLKNGLLKSVEKNGRKVKKTIEAELLINSSDKPKIQGLKRISKPGRRVYYGVSDIKPIRHGYGLLVLSTPKGVLSGDEARKNKVGGEALFAIW